MSNIYESGLPRGLELSRKWGEIIITPELLHWLKESVKINLSLVEINQNSILVGSAIKSNLLIEEVELAREQYGLAIDDSFYSIVCRILRNDYPNIPKIQNPKTINGLSIYYDKNSRPTRVFAVHIPCRCLNFDTEGLNVILRVAACLKSRELNVLGKISNF